MKFSHKRIILLQKDESVVTTKKTIQKLWSTGALNKSKWVLIPIASTLCSYIAVDGDSFIGRPIAAASVRYHMQLMRVLYSRGETPETKVVYDYYPTAIECQSVEELYNVLVQVGIFRYWQAANGSGDYLDEMWYLAVTEIEVTSYDDSGKVIDKFHSMMKVDRNVPFEYDIYGELWKNICIHYSLMDYDTENFMQNLVISGSKGEYHWYLHRIPLQHYDNVDYVGIGCAYTKTFTLLSVKDYITAMDIQSVNFFIMPLNLIGYEQQLPELLTPAHALDIPKYSFSRSSADDYSDILTELEHQFGGSIHEIFSFTIYDPDDVVLALEFSQFNLRIYHEGIKSYQCSMRDANDVDACALSTTVLAEYILNLEFGETYPTDQSCQMSIVTDVYEDNVIRLDEILYLIHLKRDEVKNRILLK